MLVNIGSQDIFRQLCFGSQRANLGMPGDLVIQERLVALKSADFLGTKVRALNVIVSM